MNVDFSYLMTVPIDVGLEIFRKLPVERMITLLKTNKMLRDKYYRYLKEEIDREERKRYRIKKIIEGIGGGEHCDQEKRDEYLKDILYDRINALTKDDLVNIVVELLKGGLETVEQERIEVQSTGEELVDIHTEAFDLATYRCLYEQADEKINTIYENELREEWK